MRHIGRFFVGDDLVSGCEVVIVGGSEHHHIRNVLRVQEGDEIRLFNGRDGEFSARLVGIDRHRSIFVVGDCLRRQSEGASGGVLLFAGVLKSDRMGYLVEKACELGVEAIIPVISEHSAPIRDEAGFIARLQARSVLASQQSERLDVARIGSPIALADVVKALPEERVLHIGMERVGGAVGKVESLWDILHDNPLPIDRVALLIGTAGGFSDSEFNMLEGWAEASRSGGSGGFRLFSLGSQVLRSETACMVSLSLFYGLHHSRFGKI